jgi:hypothetical protein
MWLDGWSWNGMMLPFSEMQSVDWTQIALQAITTVGIIATAFIAAWMNRRVRGIREEIATPSGEPIGSVAELTHDLASTNHAQLVQHGQANRAVAAETGERLSEIQTNVNGRLDSALEKIDELRAELVTVREARDEARDEAAGGGGAP